MICAVDLARLCYAAVLLADIENFRAKRTGQAPFLGQNLPCDVSVLPCRCAGAVVSAGETKAREVSSLILGNTAGF